MATELQHRTNSLKKNKTTMNSNTSVFSPSHSRIPDDTVFFSLYPDTSLTTATSSSSASLSLQSLHLQILEFLSTLTSSYIWQHAPFTLSISLSPLPHLHGSLRFGDNIEDEWFLVYLLFQVSSRFSGLSIRVYDTDGEFLLIEAAFYLPRWINPETAVNRVFIRNGHVCIIPRKKLPNPNLIESLRFLIEHENEARVDEAVEGAIKKRISEYPERARKNVHFVRVRVPVSVAKVLKYEPCLISLAVEGFYDRDIDTMKYAAKMERFVPKGREEELVCVGVKMSRAMYAQLMQQKFQAPKCYPMPNRGEDVGAYLEAELGMKITCGFEMMYQQRKKEGEEGKGSSWERYKDVLEKSGYFCGMLPGSLEYKRLLEKAEEYYRNGSLFSRTSEMMNAPVRRIDEILTSSSSADEFKNQEVPPSDNDSWMYDGEDELNTSLQERQRELDIYNAKLKNKQKSGEPQDAVPSSSSNFDDFDLQDIAKSMRGFVEKMSSYKGAEVPEDRNLKEVDIDVERFLKDVESVFKRHNSKDNSRAVDSDEASSSDMEFDEFEDGSDVEEHMQKNEEGEESFMDTYTDALDEQLKDTTLKKSFIRGNGQSTKNIEGTSDAKEAMDEDEEFTPVDVDFNLVKNLLDSFSSQQGEPGPTSNLLGLMGLQLPQDSKKGK